MVAQPLSFSLGVALIVGVFCLGNLISWQIGSASVRITLLDLLVAAFWLVNLRAVKSFRVPRYQLIFLLIAILSLLFSATRYSFSALIIGALYLLRFASYSLLYLPASRLLKPAQTNIILKSIFLILPFISLAQYIFLPDTRYLSAFNWDDHYYRVIAPFLDPGFTALILVLGLGYLWFYHRHLIALSISYLALALTYSRAGYLAFIALASSVSLVHRRLRIVILAVLLLVGTIVVLPRPGGEGVNLSRTNSITARLLNWQSSLTIFSQSPVLGVGFNQYRYAQKSSGILGEDWQASHSGGGADSSLLFVLATTGILGLVAFLFWQWQDWQTGSAYYRCALVVILIHSCFLNSWFYPPVLFLLSLVRLKASPSQDLV